MANNPGDPHLKQHMTSGYVMHVSIKVYILITSFTVLHLKQFLNHASYKASTYIYVTISGP